MKLTSRLERILKRTDVIHVLYVEIGKLEDRNDYLETENIRLLKLVEEMKTLVKEQP